MVLNYYPGCTLKNQAAELDRCARASAEALGVTLEELPQWQCCGGVYPMACHHVLKRTNEDFKRDETFRDRANRYLELPRPYEGQTKVVHFLELLRDTVGFDHLKEAVKRPLTGRKIGAYYGCLLLRPGKDMAMDDPENPGILEDFLRALGAEPVVYAMRNECCGGYVTLENRRLAQAQAQSVVDNAAALGAELLVTACPLCRYNLTRNATGLPTVYFTQLLAQALGLTEEG